MRSREQIEADLKELGYVQTTKHIFKLKTEQADEFYAVDFGKGNPVPFKWMDNERIAGEDVRLKGDEVFCQLWDVVMNGESEEVEVLENENTFADDVHDNQKTSNNGIVLSDNKTFDNMHVPVTTTKHVPVNHEYTVDQVNTIKNTVAKGATDDELAMFLHLSQTYGLDPFLKEIFYSSQMKTIITSRDGYLKVAQRDPEFDGIQSMAVCENDDFSIDMVNNVVNHSFGKGARGSVIGAWAVCYRKGRRPVIAYADYDEYNKKNSIWNTYKSAMCCKVAEVFALKRQFGISGLVTQEELGVEQ